MIELLFELQPDEDGWPPVAIEGLWCDPIHGHHRVATCPLFVRGLSVGDLIDVRLRSTGEVAHFDVVEASGNSTMWVVFWEKHLAEPILGRLRAKGCDTTTFGGWKEVPHCSVNVPEHVDFAQIDTILEPEERAKRIAVAYPSFRHADT